MFNNKTLLITGGTGSFGSRVLERILESNKKPITINKTSINPKTSIGISVYPEDGETVEMLIEKADQAMYYAKKMGKNRYSFNKSDL